MKKITQIIIFLSTFILFSPLKAQDANPALGQTSIGVSPSIAEVVMNTDGTSTQEISVLNLTDNVIPIMTTKEGFPLSQRTDLPADKLSMYDASSWITLSESDTDFILQPQEIKKIVLNIKQPENSSPGGHYATVYFQSLTREDKMKDNSASINVRIGVLLLIQVPGNIVNELKIKEFSSSSLSNNSQLTFNLKIENTGNVHQLPSGKVTFYNDSTNEVIKTVDLDNKLILPGIVNNYIYSIDPGYQMGRVSAKAVITYGPSNTVLSSEQVHVTIFPFILIGIIFFLTLLVIIFRKRVIKAVKVLFKRDLSTNLEELPIDKENEV